MKNVRSSQVHKFPTVKKLNEVSIEFSSDISSIQSDDDITEI